MPTESSESASPDQEVPKPIKAAEADVEWEFVAHVEVDRFCDECGYNLFTQPVGKHPELGLLLIRCSDCGHIHAARDQATSGSVWMRRFSVPLIILWLAILFAFPFFNVMAQVGMNIGSIEEARDRNNNRQVIINSDGTQTTRYIRTIDPNYPNQPEEKLFINMFRALFFLLGMIGTVIATVVLPHWHKWGYIAVAIFLGSIAPIVVGIALHYQFTGNLSDGLRFAYVYFGIFVTASIIAAYTGRIIARAIVRLALPPKLRTPFTYLWTVDGKVPPPMKLATA